MSSQQQSKFAGLKVYTVCISILGVGLLLWLLSRMSQFHPDTLLFVGLIVVAELATVEMFVSQMLFSISSAVTFAVLLLFGPLPAALVAMVGGILSTLVVNWRHEKSARASLAQRVLFNMGTFGLSVWVAGQVYVLAGGQVGDVARLGNLWPMVLAAVADEAVNSGLIVGVVALQTRQKALDVWRKNVSWATPMTLLGMIVGGGGLALGYHITGILGLGIFFLPIGFTIYAFQLYVRQTRSQMECLEQIVAMRTDEVEKANEELRRLDQTKTNFYSVINHEMRTPLTAILGYIELLTARTQLSTDQLDMLSIIECNSQQLLELVNNILDVSRIEEGRLTIVRQILDVLPGIQKVVDIVRPMAEKKHISIRVEVPPTLLNVRGDRKRVNQILLNLLNNAVKYTPDTGCVTISGRNNEATGMLEISVADNGVGIPAEQLPHIFDRFSRVERAEIQHIVGTGLGLSIVKGLVEAHEGEIWVESEEGYGTCFTFTLPISEVQLSQESVVKEQPKMKRVGLAEPELGQVPL